MFQSPKMTWMTRALLLLAIFIPASSTIVQELVSIERWYRLGALSVPSPVLEQPTEIKYVGGGPVRNFLGSYSVTIRQQPLNGVVCDARGGPFEYKVGSSRPDPLRMDWWAPSDRRCSDLPPGDYVLETCWTVEKPFAGYLAPITECLKTDPFRVQPKD